MTENCQLSISPARPPSPNPVATALYAHQTATPYARAFADADDLELTYSELWQASAAIASRVRALADADGNIVVAVVSSTTALLDFVSAYFGVLLAGYCVMTVPAGVSLDLQTLLIEPDIVIDARDGSERGAPISCAGRPAMLIDKLRTPADTIGVGIPAEPVPPHAPAEILYTSGTTGQRKGVIVTYDDIAKDLGHERWNRRAQRGSVLHALAFGSTPAQSLLLEPLRPFGYSVRAVQPDVDAFLRAARQAQPTSTVMVPTMAIRVAAAQSRSTGPLLSLRSVRVMSAPLSSPELRRVAAAFPNAKVTNILSSTESWPADMVLEAVEPAGRASAAGHSESKARIVSEAGKPLAPGLTGYVELRRPGRERQYLVGRNRDGTLRTLPTDVRDGWVRTGDLGRIDARGRLTLLGRAHDDVLNVGGVKVTRSDIEDVVSEVSGVAGVVAVGLPHPTLGQYVAVAVSPANVDRDSIRRQAFRRLPQPCVPRQIVCLDDLPRTAQGTPDRTAVENMLAGRYGRPARERS